MADVFERIIRSNYTSLSEGLSVPDLVDHLFEKEMVSGELKEKIEKRYKSDSRREANKLYIDHLLSKGTLPTLKKFAQLLVDTSDKLCNEVHKELGTTLLKEVEEQSGGEAGRPEQQEASKDNR